MTARNADIPLDVFARAERYVVEHVLPYLPQELGAVGRVAVAAHAARAWLAGYATGATEPPPSDSGAGIP